MLIINVTYIRVIIIFCHQPHDLYIIAVLGVNLGLMSRPYLKISLQIGNVRNFLDYN